MRVPSRGLIATIEAHFFFISQDFLWDAKTISNFKAAVSDYLINKKQLKQITAGYGKKEVPTETTSTKRLRSDYSVCKKKKTRNSLEQKMIILKRTMFGVVKTVNKA